MNTAIEQCKNVYNIRVCCSISLHKINAMLIWTQIGHEFDASQGVNQCWKIATNWQMLCRHCYILHYHSNFFSSESLNEYALCAVFEKHPHLQYFQNLLTVNKRFFLVLVYTIKKWQSRNGKYCTAFSIG